MNPQERILNPIPGGGVFQTPIPGGEVYLPPPSNLGSFWVDTLKLGRNIALHGNSTYYRQKRPKNADISIFFADVSIFISKNQQNQQNRDLHGNCNKKWSNYRGKVVDPSYERPCNVLCEKSVLVDPYWIFFADVSSLSATFSRNIVKLRHVT